MYTNTTASAMNGGRRSSSTFRRDRNTLSGSASTRRGAAGEVRHGSR